MTIIIKNDILKELFPETAGKEELKEKIEKFYTIGSVKPTVKINDDHVIIDLDFEKAEAEEVKAKELVDLCEASKYEEAKIKVKELIQEFPSASDYHRILGQIFSETGDQDEAINALIDALRWNPKNHWALMMMGNIFSRYKQDLETSMTYYREASRVKPDDNLILNNIAANLLQLGNLEEAQVFFEKAQHSDPDYPNTYLGLALLHQSRGEYNTSFDLGVKAIEKSKTRDEVFQKSIDVVLEAAKNLSNAPVIEKIVMNLQKELEVITKKIKFEEDSSISTAAKIEFAENYNRNYHIVKFKPNYPAVSHLILHELMHLKLVHEAREAGENKLFTSNESHKVKFFNSNKKEATKLEKSGVPVDSVKKFMTAMFDGLNSQMYNTPIDLFIEDKIYKDYKDFRPVQFLSLLMLIKEGVQATTQKDVISNAPKSVISKSKILNLVNAILFKDLFKLDMINDFRASKLEINQAEELFEEFKEYRNDREPGEEYEIIQHWAEDLGLENYFELIPEEERRRKTIDEVIEGINQDPYGQEGKDLYKERKMKKFFKEHSSGELNMAVAMYMVSALEFFKGKSQPEVKKIAFEFATLGMTGIDPGKQKGYSVPSIEGSDFSGYKTLAYYYVSWALAIPEMLQSLQMPFDKEYNLAIQFQKE